MKLFNTYTFTISFLLGTTLAEFNWDYGNWSPILGPCLSCNPSNVFEIKSNIHSSFGESNSRGRQLQFAQAQPAFIQQEENDADNSLDQIQLVYLPEGSLRELRSAKVARVLESQLRPVRQASLQNFEEFERGSFNQQLPSFREISPKRPTALIAEIGKEFEAQQQIDLLEAALNSQHENVKPGELPRVFIAPTHIPPPPGYVKIPLLPSQNSVQNRQTLPGTFLTSEFHSQLPNGFVQLPLPQNVAHLSHDIPFVHPDSNPLLLAHFSPASTLRGSPISQNRPAERQNELRTSVQEPTQFSGSVRGSNQNELRTPVQEPNQFPSSVRGSNQNELRTPVQEPNQFPSSVRGSNQHELRTPVQESNQFPSSVRGSNQNELRTPVQQPNQFPSSVRGSDQVRTSTRESSNQFPSPNLELNQVRIAPSSLLRQPEGRRPQASSADQSGQSQNFGQIPVAASVGFTESNFGFNDGLSKQNVQSDPNIDFTSDPFIQPNEVRVQQTARQSSHRFQIGTPVISPTEIFTEEEQPLADDSRFQTNQFNQENNFGFQDEKINVFDAPELPTQTFESSHIQKNQRERLIPRPVSNEGQFLREPVTPKQQINADSHFFANEASGVTFEEVEQTLTPLPETSLAEEHPEDLLTPFRLSPKPVSSFPSHSFSSDSSNTLPTTTEFELELTTSLPELIISTSPSTEEKALESSTASELPSGVRTRGRKRIRPDAARTRGRLQNRNRINAIQSEDLGKNDLKVASGIPEEKQNEHALDNTVTSTPGRLANRARVPARRPRPNSQRVAPTKSEVAESAATAEESTLFPPFSIARQQSSQNKGSDNVETVSPQRKDSSLLRGRFGSRTRSKIHEANEDKPNEVSVKNENTITEEAVHATSTTSESDVINREQAGVRNRGRPVPEWLKNRRRTRVLSRVRKVDPSDAIATTPDVSDSLIGETDLKGAESASFLISQPAEGKVSEQNEQTLIDNKHTDAKDSEKTKFYNIPTDNLEATVGNFELAVDLEATTENIFDDILETLHLEKATEETPIEVATLKYLNENENLPVVELHEELTEQKVDEGRQTAASK